MAVGSVGDVEASIDDGEPFTEFGVADGQWRVAEDVAPSQEGKETFVKQKAP